MVLIAVNPFAGYKIPKLLPDATSTPLINGETPKRPVIAELKPCSVLLHKVVKSPNGTYRPNPAEKASRKGGILLSRVKQVVLPNALSI